MFRTPEGSAGEGRRGVLTRRPSAVSQPGGSHDRSVYSFTPPQAERSRSERPKGRTWEGNANIGEWDASLVGTAVALIVDEHELFARPFIPRHQQERTFGTQLGLAIHAPPRVVAGRAGLAEGTGWGTFE